MADWTEEKGRANPSLSWQAGNDRANPSLTGSNNGDGADGENGNGTGPTDEQKKLQANLAGISGYNFQTPQLMVNLGDKSMNISDTGNKNLMDNAIKNAKRKASSEWYKSQQDLQSVVSQLSDASGNMMNGSAFQDFLDLIARRDDQQDVEVLNAAHENESSIMQDYYEALQQNINSRNQMYIDAQEAMRNVAADYAAQSNNIHPDLASGIIDQNGHTLTLPEWLQSDNFAESRFRQAVEPQMQGFYRPAMDAQLATNNGLDREPTTVNQPSTNQSYWTRMRQGYGRRNQ